MPSHEAWLETEKDDEMSDTRVETIVVSRAPVVCILHQLRCVFGVVY